MCFLNLNKIIHQQKKHIHVCFFAVRHCCLRKNVYTCSGKISVNKRLEIKILRAMKNLKAYSHIVEKEIQRNKILTREILDKFESKFNKGSLVVAHHFNQVSSELIRMVKYELEQAGFKPEFIGNKPNGHIVLRVSLIQSSMMCN